MSTNNPFAPLGQERSRIRLPRVPRRPRLRRSTRGYIPTPRWGEERELELSHDSPPCGPTEFDSLVEATHRSPGREPGVAEFPVLQRPVGPTHLPPILPMICPAGAPLTEDNRENRMALCPRACARGCDDSPRCGSWKPRWSAMRTGFNSSWSAVRTLWNQRMC